MSHQWRQKIAIAFLTVGVTGLVSGNFTFFNPSLANTTTEESPSNDSDNNPQSNSQSNTESNSTQIDLFPWIKRFWNPPDDLGAPVPRHRNGRQVTTPGGTRSCNLTTASKEEQQSKPPLTALVPTVLEGKTHSLHPTLLVYLPYESVNVAAIEFRLANFQDMKNSLYKTTLPIQVTPGIHSITIPNEIALERGERYYWMIDVICRQENQENLTNGENVSGAITLETNELDSTFIETLEKASPLERVQIYGQQGWWYDVMANLAKLRCEFPNDPQIDLAWTTLLEKEGLEDLTEIPISLSCSALSTVNSD